MNGQIPVPAANENVAPQQQEVANDNLDINDDPANQELAPVPANQNIGEGRGWEILDFNYHCYHYCYSYHLPCSCYCCWVQTLSYR